MHTRFLGFVVRHAGFLSFSLVAVSAFFRFFHDGSGSDGVVAMLLLLLATGTLAYSTINLNRMDRP